MALDDKLMNLPNLPLVCVGWYAVPAGLAGNARRKSISSGRTRQQSDGP